MNLRKQFERETNKESLEWINEGIDQPILIPTKSYLKWLEEKLIKIHNVCHDVEELKDGYHDTEAQLRDEILTDIIQIIDE